MPDTYSDGRTTKKWHPAAVILALLPVLAPAAQRPDVIDQEPNTWVKRSPRPGGRMSLGLGYEAALADDLLAHRVIRYGGHNWGGGEQNPETWIFDLASAKWEFKEASDPSTGCGGTATVRNPITSSPPQSGARANSAAASLRGLNTWPA